MSNKTNVTSAVKKPKKRSQFQETMRRLSKNRSAMIGLAIIILVILISVAASIFYDYDTQVISAVGDRLQHPNLKNPFGTDELGRDIFTRVLYGARYSLSVSFVAVLVSLIIGVPLGAIAGFCGGVIENIIMRFNDILLALPSIFTAIAIVSALGKSTLNLMIAVGVCSICTFAQVTRSAVLTVRNNEYVEAARALGATNLHIIFQHILPNCLAPIIVQTTFRMGQAIISAASLSFLGLGIPLPAPEWGAMLSAGRNYLLGYSYMTLFPGLALLITVIAFNMVGDGLRDALDPKLKH